MQLRKYNYNIVTTYIICLILNITYLNSNNTLENILSKNIREEFDLNRQKNEQEYKILKKDWINPIRYNLKKEYKDNINTLRSIINISQPIFKSGGIYKSIKYANSINKYLNIVSVINEKFIINKAFNIL